MDNLVNDPKYIRFKSGQPYTPFAPQWDYIMYEGMLKNIDFTYIKNYILDKEEEILSLPNTVRENKKTDGYTGLGNNSTTSRFDRFNVLCWEDDDIQ